MHRARTFAKAAVVLGLLSYATVSLAQDVAQNISQNNGVPATIRFNGVLQDGAGQAAAGVQGVTFALYAEQQGGAPLWLETQNVTFSGDGDAAGNYTVLLGSQRGRVAAGSVRIE